MSKKTRFTPEDRELMAKLVQEDGLSGPQIAERMGCSTNTVYKQLNRYGKEHGIPKDDLRVLPQKTHVFDDPIHKTWPLGSHQNIVAKSNSASPKEETPEASVEDTAVTTVDTSPKEEAPEAGVEDTVVADSKDAKHDPCKDDIDKLIDKIREMLAKNIEIINKVN